MDKIESGKRIKLISMMDPYTDLVKGDMGTISGMDDAGHILMKWDKGSTLSLCPDLDEYIIESNIGSNIIGWKKFLELKSTSDVDFLNAKMEELSELAIGSGDCYFDWDLNGLFLEARLSFKSRDKYSEVEWCLDISNMNSSTSISVGPNEEKIDEEVSSIEEFTSIIEKGINEWLGLFESILRN